MSSEEHHNEQQGGTTGRPDATSEGQNEATGQPRTGRGPMGRLANESRALFDDLREWVDLRVQLVQVDVEERIEKAANEIITIMIVVVMALFTAVFLLHGVAVWIGSALGGMHWGYLIVAVFLGLLTLVLRFVKPNHMRRVAGWNRSGEEDLAGEVGQGQQASQLTAAPSGEDATRNDDAEAVSDEAVTETGSVNEAESDGDAVEAPDPADDELEEEESRGR